MQLRGGGDTEWHFRFFLQQVYPVDCHHQIPFYSHLYRYIDQSVHSSITVTFGPYIFVVGFWGFVFFFNLRGFQCSASKCCGLREVHGKHLKPSLVFKGDLLWLFAVLQTP